MAPEARIFVFQLFMIIGFLLIKRACQHVLLFNPRLLIVSFSLRGSPLLLRSVYFYTFSCLFPKYPLFSIPAPPIHLACSFSPPSESSVYLYLSRSVPVCVSSSVPLCVSICVCLALTDWSLSRSLSLPSASLDVCLCFALSLCLSLSTYSPPLHVLGRIYISPVQL